MSRKSPARSDPDAAAISRASRSVGLQLVLASTVLVVAVVVAAFAFVFSHLNPTYLFGPSHDHDSTIDVGGVDILLGAVAIGVGAIVLAGLVSWFATRRAMRPLGDALRLQRNFVSNASHELRTPLAVLDARLQQLQRGLSGDDPVAGTVAELRRDTGTLVKIVNDLLLTAEDDRGSHGSSAPVGIKPVLELAVASMNLLAAERGITITLDAAPITIAASETAVHRSVIALLDNALHFAPDDSTIEVSARTERGFAEIRVADHGPGITGVAPEQAFERFMRGTGGDASAGGFGIGLSLVRDTVARFGGTAQVESTGPDGTVILLRLPRSRRP